jgi:hypothetical protein
VNLSIEGDSNLFDNGVMLGALQGIDANFKVELNKPITKDRNVSLQLKDEGNGSAVYKVQLLLELEE